MATSRLGFGCSNLFAGADESNSRRLIDQALELGITHFDVAPPYGRGDAEDVIGRALSGYRQSVTISTKVGIGRPSGAANWRRLRSTLSPLKRFAPATWKAMGETVRRSTQPAGQFRPDFVNSSLSDSLKRLKREKIDVYLLHEACVRDVSPQLVDLLAHKKDLGVIGNIGLGTSLENALEIRHSYPDLKTVIQIPDSEVCDVGAGSGQFIISHRAIANGLKLTRAWRKNQQSDVTRLSKLTGIDLSDDRRLAPLFLSWALDRNPTGIVLFSTSKAENISYIVRSLSDPGQVEVSRLLLESISYADVAN